MLRFAALSLLLTALATAPAAAQASDSTAAEATPPEGGSYFVMLGVFSDKTAAQAHAHTHDGWVLRTDLYNALTPGFFAVVNGPFGERADAEIALTDVQQTQPDAYVRRGGYPYLLPELGDPGLLAAFLGAVQVRVVEHSAACAPSEPHLTVAFVAPATESRAEIEIGRVWLIDRTGEVRPVQPCTD